MAWENSSPSIEAWENSSLRGHYIESKKTKISLLNFAIAILPFKLKLKIKKSKTALIQRFKPITCWFARNGLLKNQKTYILYKRVSDDFKTQEGTPNKTSWKIGTIVTHPNWCPDKNECGEGKFHAVSRPYFADEFRNQKGDRYIAIEIKKKDLYEWKANPQYPHKIGFREGKVLYEVDRYGWYAEKGKPCQNPIHEKKVK
jgi:hypothetical protein